MKQEQKTVVGMGIYKGICYDIFSDGSTDIARAKRVAKSMDATVR